MKPRRFDKIMKIKNKKKKENEAIKLIKFIAKKSYFCKRGFYYNPYMRYLEEMDKIAYFSSLNLKLFRDGCFEWLEADLKKYNCV